MSKGWVLTAITFIISVIELGTFKSFGVFMLPIRESLACSTTALGTAFAAAHTTAFALVPLANILGKKYGARRLVIGGGLFMCFSALGTFLATNVAQFSVFLVLWGIGVAMAYGPPVVELLPFFPTNAALPVAIISTGAAVGMMLFPPLAEILIEIYGWRGVMLISSAVNANICVLGTLIKPLSPAYKLLTDQSSPESRGHSRDKQRLLQDCCKQAAKGLCEVLSLDVLWYEPILTIHAFACFTVGIMYSAWVIYLVPHAVARGVSSQSATFLSSAGGVGTLVGRIFLGPILHREYIRAIQLFTLLALANTSAFLLDSVVSAYYPGLVCLAFTNGLSLGTKAVMFFMVAQQVLSEDLIVRGWGNLLFSFAVGEMCGGALAGAVYDITGSYDTSFWLLGGLSAVTTLVLVVERLLDYCFAK